MLRHNILGESVWGDGSEAVGKKWCHSAGRAHLSLHRHKKSSREQKPTANLRGWWVKGVDAVMGVLLWPVTYKGRDLRLVLISWEKVWPGDRKIFQLPFISLGMYLWHYLFTLSYLVIYTRWYTLKDDLTREGICNLKSQRYQYIYLMVKHIRTAVTATMIFYAQFVSVWCFPHMSKGLKIHPISAWGDAGSPAMFSETPISPDETDGSDLCHQHKPNLFLVWRQKLGHTVTPYLLHSHWTQHQRNSHNHLPSLPSRALVHQSTHQFLIPG